ncbi:hypothetical protein JCM14467A_03240 [Vulcanisaeta sp. JCM 14467]
MIHEPKWLIQYGDIINKLRIALYKFENSDINLQSFINEINKSLISCGYDPIKVIMSDFMTSFFDAYAVYVPRKPMSIIYVSTELMKKPRPLLGRVLMHEVFHHVLFQRPPSLLFKLAPRRVEPLILIAMPLMIVVALALLFYNALYNFLYYVIVILSLAMSSVTSVLIKALNEHELVATAFVVYLITGEWVRDWKYYRDEDVLMNTKWRELVIPKEVTVM